MSETIRCKCGQVIGALVKIEGKEFMQVQGIAVTALRGVCMRCGEVFYWSVAEKMLAELLNRVRELRK